MSTDAHPNSPDGLGFEVFRKRAGDAVLSPIEKVGFPESYRRDKEGLIVEDIVRKLPCLNEQGKVVIDIGPGCSEVAQRLVRLCHEHRHALTLVDSTEMLDQLPAGNDVRKIAGRFPYDNVDLASLRHIADAVVCYSVLHYEFSDGNAFQFVDAAMDLLKPGGALLLGDIPNVSMRKRFLASAAGRTFHHQLMQVDADPEVHFNVPEPFRIDDAVVIGLLLRARAAGFHAFVLPQDSALPMASRREDLLIRRP
ncbi:MAG: class I SAM-dependent methyltransferase [Burkholderiaceae bacterium]|nr:class I SAM-dependent methyltransferase [Burkholderiaceae bacterium]